MPLIKTIKRLIRWRPARKGETGYEARQYVLKHPKDAAEAGLRASRRAVLEKKGGGKTLEALATERRETYPRKTKAKLDMAAFKRRTSFGKKKIYEGESAKDIAWFERFKAKRLERHISEVTGEEVGGAHKPRDYERGRAFAERHGDVEKDFLKYVSSPVKKRGRKRRLDAKGRDVRDMKRQEFRARRPNRKAAA